jgi:hypothetical protein
LKFVKGKEKKKLSSLHKPKNKNKSQRGGKKNQRYAVISFPFF